MRRLLWIALLLFAVVLLVVPVAAQEPTLAELVTAAAQGDTPEFTTLLAALQAADPSVLEALSSPDSALTVFAPTDAAFAEYQAALGDEAFAALLADPAALTDLLLYHVTPGVVSYGELQATVDALAAIPFAAVGNPRVTLPTLQGQHLDVLPGFESLQIDRSALRPAAADQTASNGVLHAIESVMVPETTTIGDIITSVAGGASPQFALLSAALDAAGLKAALSDPTADPVTLFAPTDEAFNAALTTLGMTAEEALADTDLLTRLLTYHIVSGAVHAGDIAGAASADPAPAWFAGLSEEGNPLITTLNGATLTFNRGADGQPQVDNAALMLNDVDGGNGVIHVISAFLLPPGEAQP